MSNVGNDGRGINTDVVNQGAKGHEPKVCVKPSVIQVDTGITAGGIGTRNDALTTAGS